MGSNAGYWYFCIKSEECHKLVKTLDKDKAFKVAKEQELYIEPSQSVEEIRAKVLPELRVVRDKLNDSIRDIKYRNIKLIKVID